MVLGDYDRTCMVLSEGFTSSTLPVNNRVLLGLALVKMGGIRFGLHHLSMAVELTPLSARYIPQLFLSLGFHSSGFYETAVEVLESVSPNDIERADLGDYHYPEEVLLNSKKYGLNTLKILPWFNFD